MKTNKDLKIMKGAYSCLPGACFEVPKGTPVEKKESFNPTQGKFTEYFVRPSFFGHGSLQWHDATHYGCRVSEQDIEA